MMQTSSGAPTFHSFEVKEYPRIEEFKLVTSFFTIRTNVTKNGYKIHATTTSGLVASIMTVTYSC